MERETFRRYGHQVVDWVADYLEDVERYPVLSPVVPGEVQKQLPREPPVTGEPMDKILADFRDIIVPGVTHWNHPRFFAYFPANNSGPSILGELLSAALGINAMVWQTCPAATELEELVMDWLRQMLGLPERFRGVIQDTASTGTLCALVCARERVTGFRVNAHGFAAGTEGGTLRVYTSQEGHSSVEKDAKIAGFGAENVVRVEVDEAYAMDPRDLEQRIVADQRTGLRPCCIVATVGTTSSTAIDPLTPIASVAERYGLWLHVDAAMSGTAALCPEFRYIHDGLELADSYCFNPHKWMFTNFDCDCFYVADRGTLIETLSILPEYLRNKATESGAVIDYRDWQIPLGRRFRSLKLWFVIRHYGVEGLRHHIRRHVQLAQSFASWVREDDRFELVVPPPLNLVCFRLRGGDVANQELLDRLNRSGDLYLTHTRLHNRFTLRLSVGQTYTESRHVERAWKRIQEVAAELEFS